ETYLISNDEGIEWIGGVYYFIEEGTTFLTGDAFGHRPMRRAACSSRPQQAGHAASESRRRTTSSMACSVILHRHRRWGIFLLRCSRRAHDLQRQWITAARR